MDSEEIITWADYEKLIALLPTSSAQHQEAKRALAAVKPRAEAAQKKEMGEMMGKLKGFGNSILGQFTVPLGDWIPLIGWISRALRAFNG
jgi:hypothetical protein